MKKRLLSLLLVLAMVFSLMPAALAADKPSFQSFFESFQSIFACLFVYDFECTVDDLLCNALFAIQHDVIDQTGDQLGIIKRIRQNVASCDITSSWHFASLLHNKMRSSVLESKSPLPSASPEAMLKSHLSWHLLRV